MSLECWQLLWSTTISFQESRQQMLDIFDRVFSSYSCTFLISGGRCYDIGEQRSSRPWQESDGQRWWCSSEIPTHQHHGAVLGKIWLHCSRASFPANTGKYREIPLSWLSLSFLYFDSSMAPYAVGSHRLVNHDSYYGRLSGVFPNCLSAPETSEGLWNSWHFYFEWRSKDYVICRQKCNYQLNGNGNLICRYSVGLLLLSVLLSTLNIFHLLFLHPSPLFPSFYLLQSLFLLFVLDNKSFPASNAGAAARPCRMH